MWIKRESELPVEKTEDILQSRRGTPVIVYTRPDCCDDSKLTRLVYFRNGKFFEWDYQDIDQTEIEYWCYPPA